MGAGEHDLVGAPATVFDETWGNLARDIGVVDRLAPHDALGDDRKLS